MIHTVAACDSIVTIVKEKNRKYIMQGNITILSCQAAWVKLIPCAVLICRFFFLCHCQVTGKDVCHGRREGTLCYNDLLFVIQWST